jgi:hypothetical protein
VLTSPLTPRPTARHTDVRLPTGPRRLAESPRNSHSRIRNSDRRRPGTSAQANHSARRGRCTPHMAPCRDRNRIIKTRQSTSSPPAATRSARHGAAIGAPALRVHASRPSRRCWPAQAFVRGGQRLSVTRRRGFVVARLQRGTDRRLCGAPPPPTSPTSRMHMSAINTNILPTRPPLLPRTAVPIACWQRLFCALVVLVMLASNQGLARHCQSPKPAPTQ